MKYIYIEDQNGVFIGKVYDTEKNVYNALKGIAGVGVVRIVNSTDSQALIRYYK